MRRASIGTRSGAAAARGAMAPWQPEAASATVAGCQLAAVSSTRLDRHRARCIRADRGGPSAPPTCVRRREPAATSAASSSEASSAELRARLRDRRSGGGGSHGPRRGWRADRTVRPVGIHGTRQSRDRRGDRDVHDRDVHGRAEGGGHHRHRYHDKCSHHDPATGHDERHGSTLCRPTRNCACAPGSGASAVNAEPPSPAERHREAGRRSRLEQGCPRRASGRSES